MSAMWTATYTRDNGIPQELSDVKLDPEEANAIFCKLAKDQKPLDEDMQTVLQDNLWDLYID